MTFLKWGIGFPNDTDIIAFYDSTGSVQSGKGTFNDRTLCVQETGFISPGSKIGIVKQCTLTGTIKTFTYNGNSYCMVYHGQKKQDDAIAFCKKRNAGLPLPKSKGEVDEYLKITGNNMVWIGLTDPTKSGDKSAWNDLNEDPIGTRYVNLRVTTIIFSSIFSCSRRPCLKWATKSGQPNGDGAAVYYTYDGTVYDEENFFLRQTWCVQQLCATCVKPSSK